MVSIFGGYGLHMCHIPCLPTKPCNNYLFSIVEPIDSHCHIWSSHAPDILCLVIVVLLHFHVHSCLTTDPTVPKMTELIKCVGQKGRHNIPEEIGTDYFNFGIFLLNDKTGTKITAFEWEYQKHSEAINREILRQWLEGRGKYPVTWATLIEVLKDISKMTLAEDIEYGLMGREIDNFSF